jgi:DNA-binding transcriptional LysR family regulator
MDRDLLAHLPVIIAVARRGGFAAAAAELNMSPSAVSHAVRLVEDRLGTPLFTRTTRSVAVTEAGQALIEAAEPALREIDERIERVKAAKGRVSGLLRLNVPSMSVPIAITPVVRAMAKRFPDVTVELFVDDALTDIVAGSFDAGVRLGEMIALDMVTVRLTPPFKTIIVASPDYLTAQGRPTAIADLARHNCIGYRMATAGNLYRWDLNDGKRVVAIDVTGSAIVSTTVYARELALAGVGLAYIFEPLVRADIAAGRLTQVLPRTALEMPGLFLYYPARAAMAPKLRAFIDTARDILRSGGR